MKSATPDSEYVLLKHVSRDKGIAYQTLKDAAARKEFDVLRLGRENSERQHVYVRRTEIAAWLNRPPDFPQSPQPRQTTTTVFAKTEVQATTFQGLLPSPEVLQKFDQVLPGLADRIAKMAEGYARDRLLNGRTARWSMILAQVFAFIVAMTIILGGFYLVLHDKSPEGITAVVAAVAAIVTAFVDGRRNPPNE